MSTNPPPVVYELDARDIILNVNRHWDLFADSNAADDVFADHVVGTSLWDHIRDRDTQSFYQMLFNAVRTDHEAITIPYRCDSPEAARYMRMEITHLGEGGLHVENITEKVEPFNRPLPFRDEVKAPLPIKRCSLCNRINIEARWMEISTAAGEGHIDPTRDRPLQVCHTICDACLSQGITALANQGPPSQ